ncbi:U1 small nuclear ribonucleoprotein 70 kDa [Eucalyptus grandis]|uniref:U1 small nuclear ribonucleoprotein 70 kDa n=1 Tax=Eucalyptus grandis TaxID=71139 RepID=UPI00192F06CB|nr:U1 small nuclear ribonucleoprotein 70 kDa [Eucalyptus grandis]
MGDYNDAMMRNQNAAVQARTKAQSRANVLQLKLIGQSHPTGLTANLLKLFEPRPPLEYKPPPEKRKCPSYAGIGQFVSHFAEPGDPEYAPPVQKAETPAQRRARIHNLRLEKGAEKATEELKQYDPTNDPNISGDPYKTLFVAKLSYETSESKLKREFESYGPIKRVRLVQDTVSQKPKGYAFIEYLHTRDMKAAYKQADGRKIDGRRVLVDVERGRTVPNWRPRRLGGGLGTSRVAVGGEDASQKQAGREQPPSGGPSRSEEPRARENPYEREKSRERGREKEGEREKSRERSHDRPRDRDRREDRHHRDRGRDRDRDGERDRGRDRDRGRGDRDRDRERDRDRDRRDRPRERDRERDREREYEVDRDRDRGRSHDKEAADYDRVESKHDRERHAGRERNYDRAEAEEDQGYYRHLEHEPGQLEADRDYEHYDAYEHHGERGRYDHSSDRRYGHYPEDAHRYDQMDEDNYHYDRSASRDRDRE